MRFMTMLCGSNMPVCRSAHDDSLGLNDQSNALRHNMSALARLNCVRFGSVMDATCWSTSSCTHCAALRSFNMCNVRGDVLAIDGVLGVVSCCRLDAGCYGIDLELVLELRLGHGYMRIRFLLVLPRLHAHR